MSEPVNLNRRRKQKRREREQKQAAANRAWHGATSVERERIARERERQARRLDGHRRQTEE
jgi:uncharacterized protein DUF4169